MIAIILNVFLIIFAVLFVCFVFVVAFGAPFLPTLKPQVTTAMNLIDLKQGETLLELGSGDGRVLIEAAKRGNFAIGIELNPILVIYSRFATFRYRKNIKIIWGNFWTMSLPEADGIFVFLLNKYMKKLDQKITKESKRPVKLVSFAFGIPERHPTKTKKGLYLYTYA